MSQAVYWIHHTGVDSLIFQIFVWLKYYIRTLKYCYSSLILVSFGILIFGCVSHLLLPKPCLLIMSIVLFIIFFFFFFLHFHVRLNCSNFFLPELLTYTLSALHSKLMLLSDSLDPSSNYSEVCSSCDYLQKITMYMTFVIKNLCGLASALPFHISHDDPLSLSEHCTCFPHGYPSSCGSSF